MAKVEANISMSLDGFVTGPNLNRYPGLGEGGEILHAWTDESRSMDFAIGEERQIAGSVITSRKVYDETGGWDAEDGFYRMPVFVVTHRPHEVVVDRDRAGVHPVAQVLLDLGQPGPQAALPGPEV